MARVPLSAEETVRSLVAPGDLLFVRGHSNCPTPGDAPSSSNPLSPEHSRVRSSGSGSMQAAHALSTTSTSSHLGLAAM